MTEKGSCDLFHPKNFQKNSPKKRNSRGQKCHQKCPWEFTLRKCPLEFAHFEKKCPREVTVHEKSPSQKKYRWLKFHLAWLYVQKKFFKWPRLYISAVLLILFDSTSEMHLEQISIDVWKICKTYVWRPCSQPIRGRLLSTLEFRSHAYLTNANKTIIIRSSFMFSYWKHVIFTYAHHSM